ncbi:MAG: alpha-galactosidase [Oscillospiraceae bacterium]|nr:alpha-galactosidase [Oscillospiraceae bacterium]
MREKYCSVYRTEGDAPVFSYRTGLSVYEEVLSKGVLVASGINTAGYPLDVLSNYPSRIRPNAFQFPSVFSVELDGQAVDRGLKLTDYSETRRGELLEAVVTLECDFKPVRLKIHTQLDGSAMYSRWFEIENLSSAPMNLNRLALQSGGLEIMERGQLANYASVTDLYSLGYFEDDNWGREGQFTWHDLTPGSHSVDCRFGRDRFRQPMVFIRNNINGKFFFCQLGWTGGCRFTADLHALPERDTSHLSFTAEITAFNPMTVIAPGETFVSPEVHFGAITGGLDEAVNEMQDHIRRGVMNAAEINPVDLTVGAGMGAEHDMSVETSKSFIRQFADMGAEIFIIDAGWECPPSERDIDWGGFNGVNEPNPDRYPNGLSELSDYCHEQGLKFAMWIEIERLGNKCAGWTEHKDWFAKNIYGEPVLGFIDFGNPEAAHWAEEELARMISEYKLDMLRIDNNVSYRDYFGFASRGENTPECISIRHFQGVYKMYQNLKRRFPNVAFENCAGGGGRCDLGMMKSFNHTWVSDWQKAPNSLLITNGMTMMLPPERVDRLFAGMGCHEFGAFDFQMRNTMLSHMSLNVVAPTKTEPNPIQMEFIRHSVELYKSFIRPMLPTAKIYHHDPDAVKALEDGRCVIELASPEGDKGVIGVFTLTGFAGEPITVLPKGLNAGKNYRITLDNSGASFTRSGYKLLTHGLKITIPASLSSELILIEEEK